MNTSHFLHILRRRPALIAAAALLLFSVQPAMTQTAATYAQQIAAMKHICPELKMVGVLGSKLTERDMQNLTRAAMTQNVEVVVGRPKSLHDIASIYKTMVTERQATLIWIPDSEDVLVVREGFEFLRTRTLHDNIGLCVPTPSLLASGGLMSVQYEDKKLTVYINHRIAALIGATTPDTGGGAIAFVSR